MGMKICGAPCSWGIDTVSNPLNPPWQRVIREAHEVGYSAIELGPYGYLPINDIPTVTEELEKNNLGVIVGVIFDDLLTENHYEELLRQVDQICALLSRLPKLPSEPGQRRPAPYLTVMDFGHPERDSVAGHSDLAPRADQEIWTTLTRHFKGLCEKANSYGIRPVIHPHCGGYVEFGDEIDRIAEEIPDEMAGFCLDTGHLAYAGLDAAQWLRKYKDRLDYVHFKDINGAVYKNAMERRLNFLESCHEGAFCPIGQGIIDYQAVRAALLEIDYNGYICIEQERDPKYADQAMQTERASVEYLKGIGFKI